MTKPGQVTLISSRRGARGSGHCGTSRLQEQRLRSLWRSGRAGVDIHAHVDIYLVSLMVTALTLHEGSEAARVHLKDMAADTLKG